MTAHDVIVVGAGALGLASAAELARQGRSVVVLAPREDSASSRAAGMIAPAFESALDEPMARHAGLLRRARDLWPAFARATGVRLHREGAEWRGSDITGMADRLRAAGFAARVRPECVETPDDWRVDPGQALAALERGLPRLEHRLAELSGAEGRFELTTDSGWSLTARAVVLACGWRAPPGMNLPLITPIKGQAARVTGWVPKRVIRAEGVYIAPTPGGAIIGATMEEGLSDLAVDTAVIDGLLARAKAVAPEMEGAVVVEAYAAVRGAAPDGLPYAGGLAPGLAVALAPRRNGWLLAPLVAGLVADALEDCDPGVVPSQMHPGRFGLP